MHGPLGDQYSAVKRVPWVKKNKSNQMYLGDARHERHIPTNFILRFYSYLANRKQTVNTLGGSCSSGI